MLPVIEQLADGALKNGMDTDNQVMNNECESGTVNAKAECALKWFAVFHLHHKR